MDYNFSKGVITITGSGKKHKITSIRATFEEDRENMPGVSRITDLGIEYDVDPPSNIADEIHRNIFNKLADKEVHDENPDWRKEAAGLVAKVAEVDAGIVEVE